MYEPLGLDDEVVDGDPETVTDSEIRGDRVAVDESETLVVTNIEGVTLELSRKLSVEVSLGDTDGLILLDTLGDDEGVAESLKVP